MKKLFVLVALLAFVATASAQVLAEANFEDGTIGKMKAWVADTCTAIPGAQGNTSSYMLEMKNGGFLEFNKVEKGAKYKITADVRSKWGKDTPTMFVQGIDASTKKLTKFDSIDLPREDKFTTVEMIYKAKGDGYHRVTIAPAGCFLVDNIKIEKIQ